MKLTTGQTIRIIRMHKGMKQGELEKKVGFSQGKLSGIEVHNNDFSFKEFERILDVLKTSPCEFFKIREGV